MNIAIIPARGGSKRIPRKNIKDFYGKPMIAYSIEAAINSGLFDRIIVSTDDKEISEVALEYGAEVPFIRPNNLSNDQAATVPVIKHAIEKMLEIEGVIGDYVCCIYATAPFIDKEDMKIGFEKLLSHKADYVVPVTTFDYPVQRALVCEDNLISMLDEDNAWVRSQDLEEMYHDVGQFYWGKTEAWLSEKSLLSNSSSYIKLERWKVQDIDSMEDWKRAEIMFKAMVK
jgi:pseudaminic acid cytidylyltransferase